MFPRIKIINSFLLIILVLLVLSCSQDDTSRIEAPIQAIPITVEDTVFLSNEKTIYAIELATGKETFRLKPPTGITTPLTEDQGVMYFGVENGDIVAIDLASKKQIWNYDSKVSIYSRPSIDDDSLFFGSDNEIVAINKNNGRLLWRYSLPNEDELKLNSGGVSYSSAVIDVSNMYI